MGVNLGNTVFVPKSDLAADWIYYPNSKIRKAYPNVQFKSSGLDAQDGEVLSLNPISQKIAGGNMIIKIKEGRIDLIDYDRCWEIGCSKDDSIVWDVYRIIETWRT